MSSKFSVPTEPLKKLFVVSASVLLVAIVVIIIVVLLMPDTTSSSSAGNYKLPEDGGVYAISSEYVAGTIGSFLAMSATLVMVDANWCSQNTQNFKFIKVRDGATPDRAIYRIQCCNTGQYVTVTYNGVSPILGPGDLDTTNSSQLWEVVQTLNQTSIHEFPTTTLTGATTYGVYAFKSIFFARNLAHASPPILAATNYESDSKQRWSLQQVTCTVSCNWD